LVTFNYDSLLEDALRQFGLPITCIDDYTKKHAFYRVFKLHGSTNWAREIETNAHIQMGADPVNNFDQLAEHWDELRITESYLFSPHDAFGVISRTPMFPAIAIPVEKKRSFECPQYMLDELIALLPQVSKILVIGWRATEAHFLALLKEKLSRSVHMWIVAGQQGEDIKDRICREMLPKNVPIASVDRGGFTDFILSRRAEQFLGS
jgi:SIR2-like protein